MTQSYETINVQPYEWKELDRYTDDGKLAIHCWALDKESVPYLIRINDFPAFCYMEFPSFVGTKAYNWSASAASGVLEWLSQCLGDDKPTKSAFKMMKKVYYYRGNKTYPMALLCFSNKEAMRHCENFLKNPVKVPGYPKLQFRLWETKIDCVRKLLTHKDVKFSQWMSIKAERVPDEDKISVPTIQEYIGKWQSMKAIPEEVCRTWQTHPAVLAFDIETYSPNHKAMPDFTLAQCKAYMISLIYQRTGLPDTRKRYGLIIGDCDDVMLDSTRPGPYKKDKDKNYLVDENGKFTNEREHETEPVPGNLKVNIIKVATEVELINKMSDLVNELDPEIITGYNIFGYDYVYLNNRLEKRIKKWKPMGRIINKPTTMRSTVLSSNAYSTNAINYLEMDGRISVDMQLVIKRDYKYDRYTLEAVSKELLGRHRGKHDVSAPQMFTIYENLIRQKKPNVPDAESFLQLSPDVTRKINNYLSNGYHEAVYDMTRVMKYCIEDSELVIDLFDKISLWFQLVELSNIVGITPMSLFTRGQQVRGLSQFYDLAARLDYVIDERENVGTKFEGGFVYEPIPGIYENIICLDFASLYPSIIQAYNICLTTLVPPELNEHVPDEKCHVFDFVQEEEEPEDDEEEENVFGIASSPKKKAKKDTVPVKKYFKFVKKEVRQGLVPQIVAKLVAERRAVRNRIDGVKDEVTGEILIPKETDPILQTILDKRQLALKVTANSFFGLLGVQDGGKLPLIEAAMCITAKGRELIKIVNEYVIGKYNGIIVYGDTDSTMVDLNIKDPKDSYQRGLDLAVEVSKLFPPPLKMEFEKAMRIICFKKKKYAAALISKDGIHNLRPEKILKRGIILARRDNCKFARKVYTAVLISILQGKSMLETFDLILGFVDDLLSGRVEIEDLTVIRQVKQTYKSDTYFMKVFADNMRKWGFIVNPGDRLDYLIVQSAIKNEGVANRMRDPITYTNRLGTPEEEKIDYLYYLEHAIQNPIDQLFYVGYKKQMDEMMSMNMGYQPNSKAKNPRYVNEPIKMIVEILSDGKKLDYARKIMFPSLYKKPVIRVAKK